MTTTKNRATWDDEFPVLHVNIKYTSFKDYARLIAAHTASIHECFNAFPLNRKTYPPATWNPAHFPWFFFIKMMFKMRPNHVAYSFWDLLSLLDGLIKTTPDSKFATLRCKRCESMRNENDGAFWMTLYNKCSMVGYYAHNNFTRLHTTKPCTIN